MEVHSQMIGSMQNRFFHFSVSESKWEAPCCMPHNWNNYTKKKQRQQSYNNNAGSGTCRSEVLIKSLNNIFYYFIILFYYFATHNELQAE